MKHSTICFFPKSVFYSSNQSPGKPNNYLDGVIDPNIWELLFENALKNGSALFLINPMHENESFIFF